MHTNRRVGGLCLCLLVVLGGCLGLQEPRNTISYYTLEYPRPELKDKTPLPVVIKVERFTVAPAYNSHRIIYQDQRFKRDEYYYHKWRSNPGDMVRYLLTRDIRESGLFKAVLPYESRFPYSFILEGSVDEFLEEETPSQWNGVVCVSIVFLKADETDVVKRMVFQKTYRARAACPDQSPRGLAQAMSTAMAEISEEILRDLYEAAKARVGGVP